MFNVSSRKKLSFFLTVLMVIGICAFVLSTLFRITVCSQGYMEYFLDTDKVTSYCTDVYNQRMAVLSENSGIPIRVFEATENIDGYSESSVSRFYSGSDTSVFTKDKINTYEALIKEYLQGNNISYDEVLIRNTAIKAAEIYADCFGLKNTQTLKVFVDRAIAQYPHIASVGMFVVLVAVILLYFLYSDKKEAIGYYLAAGTSSGVSLVIIGLISLFSGIGKSAVITPAVYGNAIRFAMNTGFVILMLSGFVLTVLSVVLSLRHNKLTRKTQNK